MKQAIWDCSFLYGKVFNNSFNFVDKYKVILAVSLCVSLGNCVFQRICLIHLIVMFICKNLFIIFPFDPFSVCRLFSNVFSGFRVSPHSFSFSHSHNQPSSFPPSLLLTSLHPFFPPFLPPSLSCLVRGLSGLVFFWFLVFF